MFPVYPGIKIYLFIYSILQTRPLRTLWTRFCSAVTSTRRKRTRTECVRRRRNSSSSRLLPSQRSVRSSRRSQVRIIMTIATQSLVLVFYSSVLDQQKGRSLKNSWSPLKWKRQRFVSALACFGAFVFSVPGVLTLSSFLLQFINRKFIPEATYSTSTEKEQGAEWAVSSEVRSLIWMLDGFHAMFSGVRKLFLKAFCFKYTCFNTDRKLPPAAAAASSSSASAATFIDEPGAGELRAPLARPCARSPCD